MSIVVWCDINTYGFDTRQAFLHNLSQSKWSPVFAGKSVKRAHNGVKHEGIDYKLTKRSFYVSIA
jgi:hypothetical protein